MGESALGAGPDADHFDLDGCRVLQAMIALAERAPRGSLVSGNCVSSTGRTISGYSRTGGLRTPRRAKTPALGGQLTML
jgi:hypothetical protein